MICERLKERHRAERGAWHPNLVPLVIEIMMDHPETLWGEACYPVVTP